MGETRDVENAIRRVLRDGVEGRVVVPCAIRYYTGHFAIELAHHFHPQGSQLHSFLEGLRGATKIERFAITGMHLQKDIKQSITGDALHTIALHRC